MSDDNEEVKLPSWHAAAHNLTKELTEEQIKENRKKAEDKETGCAIITIGIGSFIGLIIFILVLAFAIMLIKHDPKTPFVIIGQFYSR